METISLEDLPGKLNERIEALDAAMGRPPFPNPSPDAVLLLATQVRDMAVLAKEKNRLQSLSACKDVTTTLPVLCAALKEGSVNRAPCPLLAEILVEALAAVCTLSTYPIQPILRDMEACLPTQSVGLFHLILASGALTAEKTRQLLGIPEPQVRQAANKSSGGKGKPKQKHPNDAQDTKQENGTEIATKEKSSAPQPLSKELLKAMLAAPLDDACRQVLISLFNTSSKFLALVGEDGELAETILDVYGHVLLPTLKPASLLPCLDEHILDSFIDLVQTHEERMLIITEKQLVTSDAVKAWTSDRLNRLCSAINSHAITISDGHGTLLSAVFLALIVTSRENEEKADTRERLVQLWTAASRAALATFLAEQRKATNASNTKEENGGVFATEDSIELVGNVLHITSGDEEKWLKPLAILSQATLPFAFDMFFPSLKDTSAVSGEHCFSTTDFAGHVEVERLLSQVLLPSLRAKCDVHRKHALQNKPVERRPQGNPHGGKGKGSGGGGGGGKKGAKKNQGASSQPSANSEAPPSFLSPVTFPSFLEQNARVFLLCLLLGARGDAVQRSNWVRTLADAYRFCATFPVQQPMTGVMWDIFVDVLSLQGWLDLAAAPDGGAPTENVIDGSADGALVLATKAISNPMWLTPLIVRVLQQRGTTGDSPSEERIRCPCIGSLLSQPLVDVALNAFLLKRGAAEGTMKNGGDCSVKGRLYPFRHSLVLGLLVEVMVDIEGRLEAAVSHFSRSATIESMLPYLDGILREYADEDLPKRPVTDEDIGFDVGTAEGPWISVAMRGIQRLRERLSEVYQLKHDESMRRQEEEAVARRLRVLERIERDAALARDHAAFVAEQTARAEMKAVEANHVRQEYARRKEQKEERARIEKEAREAKRKEAAATLRAHQTQSQQQREAERLARLSRYKERMESMFRVSVFLEHLELVPSRVMEVRQRLGSSMDRISPDELLEFVVTGSASIPRDMQEEEDAEGNDTEAAMESSGQPDGEGKTDSIQREAHSTETTPAVRVTDFWGDVAREGTQDPDVATRKATEGVRVSVVEGRRLLTSGPPLPSHNAQMDIVHERPQAHSLHYRLAPVLDLFCFAGGNEYGDLPRPLPSLKVSLACKVVPRHELAARGWDGVTEAFLLAQKHGLVTIHGSRVTLTVLGFRYHFPFHDPEGMLEVRIERNRLRVRETVGHSCWGGKDITVSRDAALADDEETDEEDNDSEESGDVYNDPNQILPDVEFGI